MSHRNDTLTSKRSRAGGVARKRDRIECVKRGMKPSLIPAFVKCWLVDKSRQKLKVEITGQLISNIPIAF